eukprot:m.231803 g.231803  ORF g.231803 m.231803 type:complete len:566 (-) comp18495_c0_seq1:137-1834(-)
MSDLLDSILLAHPTLGAAVEAAIEVLHSKTAHTTLRAAEHVVVAVFAASVARMYMEDGTQGLANLVVQGFRSIPGFNKVLTWVLSREAATSAAQLQKKKEGEVKEAVMVPKKGMDREEVLRMLRESKERDSHDEKGRLFGYVYTQNDEAFEATKQAFRLFHEQYTPFPPHAVVRGVADDAYAIFQHANALNPQAFPSLLKFETETIAMFAHMLHGPGAVGSLTTGIHENAVLVVKTYRDRARATRSPWVTYNMVAPASIHPTYAAAAAALNVELIRVPLGDNLAVQAQDLIAATNSNTIAILASCPEQAYGLMDPIEDIAQLAQARGIPVHVDTIYGITILSQLEQVPRFDFAVPGVQSISVCMPSQWWFRLVGGVFFRDQGLRKHSIYAYSKWPGGLFASLTLTGTRAGGPIAAAWAVLKFQGQENLQTTASRAYAASQYLQKRLNEIPGVVVPLNPHTVIFVICAENGLDLFAVADVLDTRGYRLARLQVPMGLRVELSAALVGFPDEFLQAFEKAVEQVRLQGGTIAGPATLQRMLAQQQDRARLASFIVETVCADVASPPQ